MKREIIFQIILILVVGLNLQKALAQNGDTNALTSTENFLKSFDIDLPEAEVTCTAGGSLNEIVKSRTSFKSSGNVFFVDKINREIGLLERALFDSQISSGKKSTVDIFIKVPNVSRRNLTDLLLKKNLVVSRNAQIIFLVKVPTDTGQDTYLYDGKDEDGNIVTSIIYTRVKKLGHITYKGEKFVAVNGYIKIRLSQPPKKLNANGKLVNVLSGSPATLICNCPNCPLHDFDLSELQSAFDEEIVRDILNEANSLNL